MDAADLRARQADTAEVLAALLREYAFPPIGWSIDSFDGALEGRIYRDSADAALADLTTVAELLGTEVGEHAPESGTSRTQLLVQGRYHRTPITVYGQVTVIGAE
ncbi:hypothetical protein FHX42_003654 [Saccharopolyspora lacisalsi]|uniref:Uncharacterized protein n=1 Tax=Halosaccharopolyspora lacisalsi TaxID=1000566 RepID=A0A839E5W7_9PSEU|nr:hypothetical protein [Halosaccharopolyspora lacisalsi]MBA8826278.1 hypothetical protein [Halosaccharopolyspora lacisalsi]